MDDDRLLRTTVGRFLTTVGHQTHEAEDGQAGLERVKALELDLVITDVMMPRLDGIEAIRRIKAIKPHLPIIAVSGSDTAWASAQTFGPIGLTLGDAETPLGGARKAGADLTLGKPFQMDDLLKTIDSALSQGRPALPREDPGPRHTFHVRPDRAAGWRIFRNGGTRPVARAVDHDAAIFLARKLAGALRSARVVVHHADGTIQAAFDYRPD